MSAYFNVNYKINNFKFYFLLSLELQKYCYGFYIFDLTVFVANLILEPDKATFE